MSVEKPLRIHENSFHLGIILSLSARCLEKGGMIFSNTKKSVKVLNLLSLIVLVLFISCEKQEIMNNLPQNSERKEELTDKAQGNGPTGVSIRAENAAERMFEDGEPLYQMTDESRRFKIGEVIRLRAVTTDTIEIANFAPTDIADLTITMQSEGREIELLKISHLSAHIIKKLYCPMGVTAPQAILNYKGSSSLIQKLKRLQAVAWQIKPHDFLNKNGGWKDAPEARDFRMMTGMMINAAYIMMDANLLAQLQADVIFKDDGESLLTAAEKQSDIERLKSITRIDAGVLGNTNNAVGLAGIGVYGLAEKLYKESYTWASTVLGHEFAHMIGYNHGSNMTYPQVVDGRSQGFGVIVQQLWNKAILAGELPITASTYYKVGDIQ